MQLRKSNRIRRDLKGDISTYSSYFLLMLWSLFIFAIFAWVIVASFSTTKGIFTGTILKWGFHPENYVKAFVYNKVLVYFLNSTIYTVGSCIGIILVSAPCAYVLARFAFRGNKFFQNMFVAGIGVPLIMIVLPLFYIAALVDIIGSRWLLVLIYIGLNVPFTVFFLISFFSNIPRAFEEVAAIDGCKPMKTFWLIILPIAQPGIITVTIFNFIAIWNEYFIALIFGSQAELRSLAVGLQSMISSMRYTGDWAGMFATVVIVFIPTVVIYVFLSEKIIAGVTGGAIKG